MRFVYRAAIISSAIMPLPPLKKVSIFLIGNGFSISKTLNKKKAATAWTMLNGIKRVEAKYPQNSSMTICLLSFSFSSRSVYPEEMIPTGRIRIKMMICKKTEGFRRMYTANAPKVPKVPGAKGRCPIKPSVAIYL